MVRHSGRNILFLTTHYPDFGSPGALGKKETSESLSDPLELRM